MEAQSSEPTPPSDCSSFLKCRICEGDSSKKSPRLLSCLHNFCSECLESIKTSKTSAVTYLCPVCRQETVSGDVTENKFILELLARSESANESVKDHACQGCEENATATSYCKACCDWLCDQCVFAHRRVRVTKDHAIESKENVHENTDPKAKLEFCSVHPREPLKYFCPSCETLTCRDCQLHEHQKHDFKPVAYACDEHKGWLLQMTDKLQGGISVMESAQKFLNEKIAEIDEKQKRESNRIKQFALILIQEVNKRGKAMLDELNMICDMKRTDFQTKDRQLNLKLERYRHAVAFTDELIKNAGNASLLQTRSVVMKQIIKLQSSQIQAPDTRYKFDIAFGFDPQIVRELMPRLGQLVYNGKICTPEEMKKRLQQRAAGEASSQPQATVHHLAGPAKGGTVSSSGMRTQDAVSPNVQKQTSAPPGSLSHLLFPALGSANISSSTGTPTQSPPALIPNQNVADQLPDSATPTRLSSVNHVQNNESAQTDKQVTKNTSRPNTPGQNTDITNKPSLLQQVKTEKKDDGYETNQTKTSKDATPSQKSHNSTSDIAANGSENQAPESENFGTILSMPDTGLVEAEHRVVYIPASAPLPCPSTPRRQESQEDDPNEDWCAVCHNGGDLLCCEFCPKVFHYKCHVPEVTVEPADAWKCGLCEDESALKLETEPSQFIMVNGVRKRKAPMGLKPQEIKTCEHILLELFCHPNSVPFHEPVPRTTPAYYQIIKTPMDFKTIKKKLEPKHFNHYKSVQEFIDDVNLVFSNCKTYNKVGSEVREWGTVVEGYFMELLQRYLPFIKFQSRDSAGATEPSVKRHCPEEQSVSDPPLDSR